MNQFAQVLIYIHIFLGGLGLIAGLAAILVRKGSRPHRTAGVVFTRSMLSSAAIAVFVASVPAHRNMFLFFIGLFTLYMVLAGNRALTFKHRTKTKAAPADLAISASMLAVAAIMMTLGVIAMARLQFGGVLYFFFGGLGIMMAVQDLRAYKSFHLHPNLWLRHHLGRMVGALIASFTAFLVAGLRIDYALVWLLPTLPGTAYIIYWSRKIQHGTATPGLPHRH